MWAEEEERLQDCRMGVAGMPALPLPTLGEGCPLKARACKKMLSVLEEAGGMSRFIQ
jgi:hypothetical protein